ncbi:hypothetical protein C8J56DRAFT_1073230 [Mycena floridula]|nr:hypothetical protein C8J56DRAFT_1073230 [Mycena floridula]
MSEPTTPLSTRDIDEEYEKFLNTVAGVAKAAGLFYGLFASFLELFVLIFFDRNGDSFFSKYIRNTTNMVQYYLLTYLATSIAVIPLEQTFFIILSAIFSREPDSPVMSGAFQKLLVSLQMYAHCMLIASGYFFLIGHGINFLFSFFLTSKIMAFAEDFIMDESSSVPLAAAFPPISNELVHSIFDFAASSSVETCKSLCLVSSWTRTMALRHLRPRVFISSADDLVQFAEFFPSNGKPWTPHTYFTETVLVHVFVLTSMEEVASAPALFSQFPSAKNITITGGCFYALLQDPAYCFKGDQLHVTIVEGGEMRHVPFLNTPDFFASNLRQRITRLTLTHLYDETMLILDLSPFTQLTHVAILLDSGLDGIREMVARLDEIKTLLMIVIMTRYNLPPSFNQSDGESLIEVVSDMRSRDERVYLIHEAERDEQFFILETEMIWERAVEYSKTIGLC